MTTIFLIALIISVIGTVACSLYVYQDEYLAWRRMQKAYRISVGLWTPTFILGAVAEFLALIPLIPVTVAIFVTMLTLSIAIGIFRVVVSNALDSGEAFGQIAFLLFTGTCLYGAVLLIIFLISITDFGPK